jgi:hypothetical protein
MGDNIVYVYGIAFASLDVSSAPRGLDDATVIVEREGELGALVSILDAGIYAGGTAEARAGDVSWIGPRAVAHDSVLTWASEMGGVVPLPMFTLFSSADAVRAMLSERSAELLPVLARVAAAREYTLRIFRLDAVLADTLPTHSPRLAALAERAESASPGQRYLIERKLDTERRAELRRVGSEVAVEVYDALAALSIDAVRDPLPATRDGGSSAGVAVLDASFLVRRDATVEFQGSLTELTKRREPSGFRFELTGPWPAYHFARVERAEA